MQNLKYLCELVKGPREAQRLRSGLLTQRCVFMVKTCRPKDRQGFSTSTWVSGMAVPRVTHECVPSWKRHCVSESEPLPHRFFFFFSSLRMFPSYGCVFISESSRDALTFIVGQFPTTHEPARPRCKQIRPASITFYFLEIFYFLPFLQTCS